MRFRKIAIFIVAVSLLPACFALFPLEGYEKAAGAGDADDDGAIDASSEAAIEASAPKRIVFITSTEHEGASLMSAANADSICAKLAATAKLSGKFHAWISDSQSSPATRIPGVAAVFAAFDAGAFDGGRDGGFVGPPLRLLDETLVAQGYDDLIANGPRVAILVTDQKTKLSALTTADCDEPDGGGVVWTSTTRYGMPRTGGGAGNFCQNWSQPLDSARGGKLGSSDPTGWTDSCTVRCAQTGRLYCFQE